MMSNLLEIRAYAVDPQQRNQQKKSGILRGLLWFSSHAPSTYSILQAAAFRHYPDAITSERDGL